MDEIPGPPIPLPLDVLPIRRISHDPDDAFSLIGRTAAVRGRVRHGIDRLWIRDRRVLTELRISDSPCTTAEITPVSVVRVYENGITERVLLLPDVAGAIIEWSATEPAALNVDFRCELSVRGEALTPAVEWTARARTIDVRSVDGDAAAHFSFSQEPASCTIEHDHAGGARIRAQLIINATSVRMRVVAADAEPALASLDNAAHLVRANAAAQRRRGAANLSVQTDEPAIGDALEWGKHYVAQFPTSHASVSLILAALAVSEYAAAATMIDETDEAAAHFLFAVSRYHAWVGDPGFINARWDRIARAAAAFDRAHTGGADTSYAPAEDTAAERQLRLAGLTGFVAFAGDTGRRGEIAEASRILERERPSKTGDAWIGTLAEPAARTWRLFTEGSASESSATEGAVALTRLAESRRPDPAGFITPLVYGLLGIDPDAPRGRLRMRLQPPRTWDRIEMRNLRIGDSAVGVEWKVDVHGHHVIHARQTEGAVPLRLILEARLEGSRLERARVDGVAASLNAIRTGDYLHVPVQIVLDEDRTIELDLMR